MREMGFSSLCGTMGVTGYFITALLFLCGRGCGLIQCYLVVMALAMFFGVPICVYACIFLQWFAWIPLWESWTFISLLSVVLFPGQHYIFFPQLWQVWLGSFAPLLVLQPNHGLSAYYQMHKKARLFLVSLVCGARSHKSHIGTFFCG